MARGTHVSRNALRGLSLGEDQDAIIQGAHAGAAAIAAFGIIGTGCSDDNVADDTFGNTIDTNADKLVSATEWNATFSRWDVDGDGFVSESEYVLDGGFDELDSDGDGLLTEAEWNSAMVDWDVDHNGSLDTDEMSVELGRFEIGDAPASLTASARGLVWRARLDDVRPALVPMREAARPAVAGGAGRSAVDVESAVARNLSRPPESAQVRSRFSDLRNGQRELTLPAPFGTLLPSRTGAATHVD